MVIKPSNINQNAPLKTPQGEFMQQTGFKGSPTKAIKVSKNINYGMMQKVFFETPMKEVTSKLLPPSPK